MATTFNADAQHSRKRANAYLVPLIKSFGRFKRDGYEYSITSTEPHNNPIFCWLDRDCGIDLLICKKNGDYTEYFPCASRCVEIKPHGSNYDCFSMRDQRVNGNLTEYKKLAVANKPRPMWHIQSFVDNAKKSATIAFVETADLLKFFATRKTESLTTKEGDSFKLAKWIDLIADGIKIFVFKICAATRKITQLSNDDLKGMTANVVSA